ncbi:MAG: ribbon-helix-helix protein, CopG family [Acidimicrobiia bacterium]
MAKARGIEWLEAQTGRSIDVDAGPCVSEDRYLSVRLSSELAAALEALAVERGLAVPALVREIVSEAVARHQG